MQVFNCDFYRSKEGKTVEELFKKQRQRQQIGTAAGLSRHSMRSIVQRLCQRDALLRRRGLNGGGLLLYKGRALGTASMIKIGILPCGPSARGAPSGDRGFAAVRRPSGRLGSLPALPLVRRPPDGAAPPPHRGCPRAASARSQRGCMGNTSPPSVRYRPSAASSTEKENSAPL